MDDLDPTRFAVHRAEVRDGVELAFVHERPSTGGFPLVVLHGWPETKRIWWGWSSRSSMRARCPSRRASSSAARCRRSPSLGATIACLRDLLPGT